MQRSAVVRLKIDYGYQLTNVHVRLKINENQNKKETEQTKNDSQNRSSKKPVRFW